MDLYSCYNPTRVFSNNRNRIFISDTLSNPCTSQKLLLGGNLSKNSINFKTLEVSERTAVFKNSQTPKQAGSGHQVKHAEHNHHHYGGLEGSKHQIQHRAIEKTAFKLLEKCVEYIGKLQVVSKGTTVAAIAVASSPAPAHAHIRFPLRRNTQNALGSFVRVFHGLSTNAAQRLGPLTIMNVYRISSVLIPTLGMCLILHMVFHDFERLEIAWKAVPKAENGLALKYKGDGISGHSTDHSVKKRKPKFLQSSGASISSPNNMGNWTKVLQFAPVIFFSLTTLLDALDATAHAAVSTGLLHYHFGFGIQMDYHTIHVIEGLSTTVGLVSIATSVIGELLTPVLHAPPYDEDHHGGGGSMGGRNDRLRRDNKEILMEGRVSEKDTDLQYPVPRKPDSSRPTIKNEHQHHRTTSSGMGSHTKGACQSANHGHVVSGSCSHHHGQHGQVHHHHGHHGHAARYNVVMSSEKEGKDKEL
mmetsp:Transcript_17963/g.32800  ORF Transcript_17963/g.32800 Transcript_17963/m.32800 type:complete len:473 (-) Transcript_17963:1226-2644(-)